MIHDLDKVCDGLVLIGLDEPLSEVALDGDVQGLLLLARQVSCLYLLLDLSEFLNSKVHHSDELLWTQVELCITKLLGKSHLHEVHLIQQTHRLPWHPHQQSIGEVRQSVL